MLLRGLCPRPPLGSFPSIPFSPPLCASRLVLMQVSFFEFETLMKPRASFTVYTEFQASSLYVFFFVKTYATQSWGLYSFFLVQFFSTLFEPNVNVNRIDVYIGYGIGKCWFHFLETKKAQSKVLLLHYKPSPSGTRENFVDIKKTSHIHSIFVRHIGYCTFITFTADRHTLPYQLCGTSATYE